MNKLEIWYEQFKCYKKLNLREAKKILNEYDDVEKVFCGTAYIIYNIIKSYSFNIFQSGSYDMDDIISVFCELWFKNIKNGNILKINNFSDIFNRKFFCELNEKLVYEKLIISENFGISKDDFIQLFILYVDKKNINCDLTYNEINEILKKKYKYNKEFQIGSIIIVFSYIYNNLNIEEYENIKFNKTFLERLLPLFINNGLFEKINKCIESPINYEDETIQNVNMKNIFNIINNMQLSKREKEILIKRFGLNGENEKTFIEIANELELSISRIRQLEETVLKKIFKECKQYKNM